MNAAVAWFNRFAVGGLLMVGLGIVATGVLVGIIAWSPTPVWDQWDAVAPEQLVDLFRPHNEHRIAMSRLIFNVDNTLAHGTGVISLAFVYIYNAAHLLLLVLLARWTWPKAGLTHLVAGAAIGAMFFFSGFQFENFVSGFQNQFTGVFFFASSAIAALCLAADREDYWRKVLIAVAVFAAIAGVCSMANGLLIAPLLVAVALLLSLRATAWIMGAVALASWLMYFRDYPVREGPGAVSTLMNDPIGFVNNVLAYVGGAAPNSISLQKELIPHKLEIARAFGVIAMLAIGALTLIAMRKPLRERPRIAVWAAIGIFVFASAAVTALGRGDLGDVAMLASRYGAGTAALWTVVAIWGVMLSRGLMLSVCLVVAATISVPLAYAQISWMASGQTYKVRRLEAEAALLSGADSLTAYLGVYPAPERAPTIGKLLKQKNLAMYYEPWRRIANQKIDPAQNVCRSEVKDVTPLARASEPTWRVSVTGMLPQDARGVAVVTGDAIVAGVLIRGTDDDIDSKIFLKGDAPPRWSGYIQVNARQATDLSFYAVGVTGQAMCRLDKSIKLQPYDTIRLANYRSVGAVVSAAGASVTGVFPPDGFNEAVGANPWGGRSWGSWGGDDKNTGRIVLTADVTGIDRVAIPFVTGPTPAGSRLEVKVDAETVQVLSAPADLQRWSAIDVRIPPGARTLEIIAQDASSAWGGWLAVGELHAICDGQCPERTCPMTFVPGEVVTGLSGGFVDSVKEEAGSLVLGGWAGDTKAREPVDYVIAVENNNRVVSCLKPGLARTDVAKSTGIGALANSGFSLTVPAANRSGLAVYSRQSDGSLARLNGL